LKTSFPNLSKFDKNPLEFKLNRKPDFRLEKNGKILYLNVDGLYIHSEAGPSKLDNNYHFKLRKSFEDNKSRIVQFRENELQRPEVIRSIVNSFFGDFNKIYARKCKIKKLVQKEAKAFFDKNHLMGNSPAPTFGLFFEDEVVCAISVKRKKTGIDITRFCNKLDTQVLGGMSKLLKHITKLYDPDFIQSFVDLRYANGHSYDKLGFTLKSTTQGWNWTDYKKTFNRLSCRANMDSRKLTQAQHAAELKYSKIYDAGQAKYVKELK